MIEIVLPAMGEGIIEAEITRWLVKEGMPVEVDAPVVEVATDKVDSEIPSPGSGIIHKILFREGDTAKIGQVLALIVTEGEKASSKPAVIQEDNSKSRAEKPKKIKSISREPIPVYNAIAFLSPVIRKLAVDNEIPPAELQGIKGSGSGGRITKDDLLEYLAARPEADLKKNVSSSGEIQADIPELPEKNESPKEFLSKDQIYGSGASRIEEMDRTRKLIADHMVYSKKVAPHVSSFVETDVTEMMLWRNRVKNKFQETYGQRLTLTTLILEAVIKALKEHPRINSSVDGYNVILKEGINLGMATALPDGNLIVPVIHNADMLNLNGLAEKVNDLASRARDNRLIPSEIQGGTFTVTNMGQFNNFAGTPIINQPEVAILAVGSILKKPAVVETSEGDTIGIRNILILTLAYDHRVVDGALGGSFLNSIAEHLQAFDPKRKI